MERRKRDADLPMWRLEVEARCRRSDVEVWRSEGALQAWQHVGMDAWSSRGALQLGDVEVRRYGVLEVFCRFVDVEVRGMEFWSSGGMLQA